MNSNKRCGTVIQVVATFSKVEIKDVYGIYFLYVLVG